MSNCLTLFLKDEQQTHYVSEAWEVELRRAQLPAITPLALGQSGGGGWGWKALVRSNGPPLRLELWRADRLIASYPPPGSARAPVLACTLYPDGGKANDYRLVISAA